MMIERITPPYLFAVTKAVKEKGNFVVDGKELSPSSFIPTRVRSKDTGYDLRCAEPSGMTLHPGCYFRMRLGIHMFAPDGWWLDLKPRSSSFLKKYIHALYGVIEEDYEDELSFVGQYLPDACKLIPSSQNIVIEYGQRIAQALPAPRFEMPVKEISLEEMQDYYQRRNSGRGTGGFGSSENA